MTDRTCRECRTTYPLTRDYFGQFNNRGRVGFRHVCRECMAKNTARHSAQKPEMVKARVEKRSRLQAQARGLVDPEYWRLFLWRRQKGVCFYCEDLLPNEHEGEIDHKTPISRRGSNQLPNLALSCPQCNREKHAKTEEEYRLWREDRGMPVNF